jgi:PAT family beta-lactamase induction signal transducer AmpG
MTRLPVLVESAVLRYLAFAVLYLAQGVPNGLFVFALPAYMAERGLTSAQIGAFVGLALLPWSFKLVGGPIMDRWSFLPMGRRRPWVIGAQVGIVAGFTSMAFLPDPLRHLSWLGVLGFAVNCMTAVQDVATDGMAIDVLPLGEQARANGFMWGGKALGTAVTTAGSAWLLNAHGFGPTMAAAAGGVGLVMLVPILFRERQGERLMPWTAGTPSPAASHLRLETWSDIVTSLVSGMALPASLIAALAFFSYGAAEGLLTASLPVLTVRELGWQDTEYARLSATARFMAGMLAMVVGGLIVDRVGRVRAMATGTALYAGSAIALGLMPWLWDSRTTVSGFVGTFAVLETLLTVALLAVGMALCRKRVAATQFALYMATTNLGYSAGASLLGPVQGGLGYTAPFVVVAACALTACTLLWFVNLDGHRVQVEALEARYRPPLGTVVAGVAPD